MKKFLGPALACLITSMPVHGNVITISGSNAGAGHLYDGYPAHRINFELSGSGVYNFETLTASFDTFIELHAGSVSTPSPTFDPLAFDDDGDGTIPCGNFFCSTMADVVLGAGSYSFFVRGASENEAGTFTARLTAVSGADIALVPEPASLALTAVAVTALAIGRRRKGARP